MSFWILLSESVLLSILCMFAFSLDENVCTCVCVCVCVHAQAKSFIVGISVY